MRHGKKLGMAAGQSGRRCQDRQNYGGGPTRHCVFRECTYIYMRATMADFSSLDGGSGHSLWRQTYVTGHTSFQGFRGFRQELSRRTTVSQGQINFFAFLFVNCTKKKRRKRGSPPLCLELDLAFSWACLAPHHRSVAKSVRTASLLSTDRQGPPRLWAHFALGAPIRHAPSLSGRSAHVQDMGSKVSCTFGQPVAGWRPRGFE